MSPRRSHPPTLLTLVRRCLASECGVRQGHTLLVAVSGGGDSQALLHSLALIARRQRFRVMAHGVDHGLRAEAGSELDLAEELAADLKVPFSRSRLAVPDGSNLMARAREARLAALSRAAQAASADFIATAHHADDRAETVLIRLLRGAGPRGLSVLPAADGVRLRPMIRARRAHVAAHLSRHGLRFALDPSNRDRRFLRVRVREELVPLLEELSPRIVDHLNALADQINQDDRGPEVLDDQGRPLPLGRAQAAQLRALVETQSARARVRLAGGWVVRILGGRLTAERPSGPERSRKPARIPGPRKNPGEFGPANRSKSD